MDKIEADGFLYAQHVNPHDSKPGTTWFGKDIMPLQGSVMNYAEPKAFRTHIHIMNPRIINKTQECFLVVKGKVKVTISIPKAPKDSNPTRQVDIHGTEYWTLGSLEAGPGEAIFVWGGFHKVETTEKDTIAYEIKSGQFNGVVSDDKNFLDEVQ